MTVTPRYSPAREAGSLVFVSGQLPFDAGRRVVAGVTSSCAPPRAP
jgi:enamine deaminase RidA (YjgF/YER057c/UK114 family)